MKADRMFTLFAVIFGGVGLLLIGIAGALTLEARSFVATAVRAEGTVIDLVWARSSTTSSTRSGGGRTAAPVVRFEGPSGPVEFRSSVSSNPPSFDIGEKVPVLYPPGRPQDARIDSPGQLYLGAIICGLLGLPFFGVGAGFYLVPALRRRRRDRARTLGQPVEARVTEVLYKANIRVGSKHPWVICAEFEDKALGQSYRFESEYLWESPELHYPVGSPVTVYFIRDEPKTYAFELTKMQKTEA